MADNAEEVVVVDDKGTPIKGEVKPNEPTVSPAEEKARSQGWVSEEEWVEQGKSADDWVDEKQFIFRGELMQRIQQQSKQLNESNGKIDQLTKALKKLGEVNSQVAEEQYKKAIQTLKRQKAEAMSDDDHEAVIDIDDKIDELKEAQKAMKEDEIIPESSPAPTGGVTPEAMQQEYNAWIGKPENNWYMSDPVLRGAADALGIAYLSDNPAVSASDVFDYVSKQIKIEMPHKFGGNKPTAPSVIEGGKPKPRSKGAKFTVKDLTEDQLKMAKTFVDTGALPDVQTYVDQLVEIGELG